MRKILLTALFLFLVLNIFAQRKSIDSLKRLIRAEQNDTSRVNLINKLASFYVYSKPDSTLLLAQQALQLAKNSQFQKGMAVSLNRMGIGFFIMANYPKALTCYLSTLKLNEQTNNRVEIEKALGNIGDIYSAEGEYPQAIIYTRKAIILAQVLHRQDLLEEQLSNLGDSYEKMNRLDSALFYTGKAHQIALKIGAPDPLGITLNNFGNVYAKLLKSDSALRYYRLAMPLWKKANDDDGICESTLGMAGVFKRLGQPDSSLYYARQSIAAGWKGGFTQRVLNASRFLTAYFKQQGQLDSAFHYQEVLIAAKDSVFNQEKTKEIQNLNFAERQRQQEIVEREASFKASIRSYLLIAVIVFMMVLSFVFWRNSRQRQKANQLLTGQNAEIEKQKKSVESTLAELETTQAQLVQSAKMASLGELTAGIAHEIQNPLNFVNNFSEVSTELMDELGEELDKGDVGEARAIAAGIKQNLQKIHQHGKRADGIVKSMMEHSRSSAGTKEPTDINKLADEYLRLAYHGVRAKDHIFKAELVTNFAAGLPLVSVIPQDIGRVLLNLLNNAFYAVKEKRKIAGGDYTPVVEIITAQRGKMAIITVKDNGNGIPEAIKEKIMQPFFTTKPTGESTGLGLSLSYDIIVKGHSGKIEMESKLNEGSAFVLQIPAV